MEHDIKILHTALLSTRVSLSNVGHGRLPRHRCNRPHLWLARRVWKIDGAVLFLGDSSSRFCVIVSSRRGRRHGFLVTKTSARRAIRVDEYR